MSPQEIHGGVKSGGRIIFPDRFHSLFKIFRRTIQQIVQKGGSERVVHDPVELFTQKVSPAAGIRNLIAGILPDLSQHQGVGIRLLHSGPELFNKLARQLVGHIQPPAGSPGPKPVFYHGIFALNHIIHVSRAVLPNIGQGADAPPGVIGPRPLAELEPVVIGAVFALSRTQGGIKAVGVKIDALRAGVVKNAIQQNANSFFPCLDAEVPKIRFCAQHGIDLCVVRRVIAVIGSGFKNGAEVQGSHVQSRQVIQMGSHTGQRASKEVPILDLTALRPPSGSFIPVFMDPAVPNQPRRVRELQAAVAVGKNLIGHALAEPGGRVALLINSELPGDGFSRTAIAGLV